MKRIKVLHVIKTLDLGGAEVNLFNLCSHYDRNKFDIHVAYSKGGALEANFKKLDVALYKYSNNDAKVKSIYTLPIILRLINYIRINNIQIVHTHTFTAHIWGAIAARLSGIKIIEHVHDPRYEVKEFLISRNLPVTAQFDQARFFARLSHRIIVLTQSNRSFLLGDKKISDDKVRIILNGIPLDAFPTVNKKQLLDKLNLPSNQRIIFTALRLSKEKNASFILEIARILNRNDLCFVIAGSGPEENLLRKLVMENHLADMVKFIGYQSNIRELLSLADIFILPTLRELHSISMIEAMSMRLPVLVSKGAGCNDEFIINGEDGFVLDPFKPQEWASTILRLIDDEDLRLKIGANALEKVKKECDIRIVASKIEKIYMDLSNV